MFKLVKLLGRFVAKMYVREARLLIAESKVLKKASEEATKASIKLAEKSGELTILSTEASDKAARVALQGQTIGKFFE